MSAGLAMMPWFTGDFMRSTRGWPLTARAVYRELLDAQWDIGNLPIDPAELAAMIGASKEEWAKGWGRCECKFPIVNGSHRQNAKLERVRATAFEYHAERSEAGKKGAAARWGKKDDSASGSGNGSPNSSAMAQPLAKPMAPSPSPSPSPIHTKPSNGKEKIPTAHRTAPNAPIEFLDFKIAYPNRAGDQGWRKAQRAAHARIEEGHTWVEILEGAKRYAAYVRSTGNEGTEYVKQAATFLGPDLFFMQPWPLPKSKAENHRDSNIENSQEWLHASNG